MMKRLLASSLVLLAFAPASQAQEITWRRVVINAESDFEAAGVADIDGDGDPDIICGDTWYEGGTWAPHPVRAIEARGGYRLDLANIPMDVDGDGLTDIVSCNWHERAVTWRRNPGPTGGDWPEETVDHPGNCETAVTADVDGDGALDFLPDIAQKTVWYRLEEGRLVPRTISAEIGGHGIGLGDVNGDGRDDILKPTGWFEAPEDRLNGQWKFHPDWKLGAAGIRILVHDFNRDGLPDVFWGMGHDYGVYWLEQTTDPDPDQKWIRHEVDNDWSQAHALRLVDFDGDGMPEIFTGKRWYAHNGNDPGADDPLVIYIYSFDATRNEFVRTLVGKGENHGIGIAPVVADVDSDGDLDIVAPGKDGLQVYLQEPQ